MVNGGIRSKSNDADAVSPGIEHSGPWAAYAQQLVVCGTRLDLNDDTFESHVLNTC